MNSESILRIAQSTDPFRTPGNCGLERVSARDLDEQRANGNKLTLWKTDRRQNSHVQQDEILMANSHAASLTSSTITQLTDS
jgi:hypothetical protein